MKTCKDCGSSFKKLERINSKMIDRRDRVRCDNCSITEKKRVAELNAVMTRNLASVNDSDSSRTGQIGEYQFALDCIKHNLFGAKPFDVSSQSDFVICNASNMRYLRIQVKTTLKHSVGVRGARRYKITVVRNDKELNSYLRRVDLIAIYCIDSDTWFIIPVSRLNGRRRLTLSPSGEFSDCIGFSSINKFLDI
jgi:hypothetical protein